VSGVAIQTTPVAHGYLEHDSLVLHYLKFDGHGRPIILLHGVTGSAWDWHHVGRELGGRLTSGVPVALDFRGHGDSGWSPSRNYRSADHAADVCALIDHLNAGPVDLVGYSWGALVAVMAATQKPEIVRSVVLADVEASFGQSETDILPRPRKFASIAEAEAARRQENPHAPSDLIALTARTGTRAAPDGQIEPKHDPYFFDRWPFRSDSRWDDLAALPQPTLLVHAEDSFVRGKVMARMAEAVPNARLVGLPATTHIVPVDNPTGILELLAEFLAEPDQAAERNNVAQ
jgi:pimeloyl-ACP methyl ester carboxylesterase